MMKPHGMICPLDMMNPTGMMSPMMGPLSMISTFGTMSPLGMTILNMMCPFV